MGIYTDSEVMFRSIFVLSYMIKKFTTTNQINYSRVIKMPAVFDEIVILSIFIEINFTAFHQIIDFYGREFLCFVFKKHFSIL